jgi:stress-induced morphogen
MSQRVKPRWEKKRTAETRQVEEVMRTEFPNTDAYRFNSASIRVRVIDSRFEGKSTEKRDAMVERLLKKLPVSTQADIINLLTLTPEEASDSFNKKSLPNLEFEHPSRSML